MKKKKNFKKETILWFLIFIMFLIFITNIEISTNFTGTSMSPTVEEGDVLILRKLHNQTEFEEGEIYAYLYADNTYNLHRYIGINNISCKTDWCQNKTFYMFKGDNEPYRDFYLIEAEDIKYKLLYIIK